MLPRGLVDFFSPQNILANLWLRTPLSTSLWTKIDDGTHEAEYDFVNQVINRSTELLLESEVHWIPEANDTTVQAFVQAVMAGSNVTSYAHAWHPSSDAYALHVFDSETSFAYFRTALKSAP